MELQRTPARKPKHPPHGSVFEFLDERRVLALVKVAARQEQLPLVIRIQHQVEQGATLRELMPGAWQPGGNLLCGGPGMDGYPLANGHLIIRFSDGVQSAGRVYTIEVGFGPRGAVVFFKDLGYQSF